ncbi:MAG: ADP-ribosylglycohydrolase family protein [Natronincolaceae bacterium]|jgi:ADP-ribosyl-[dinitrogen reductase] hydrolase|nr:ADP-ribosylglycohydrolase family protein [Bacillota bacterium]NLK90327.1 hypothetical protein [Clostridiales bacterium]
MDVGLLGEIYTFLVESMGMPNLNIHAENINLTPLPNIDYRDKISGAIIGLSVGDVFDNMWEKQKLKETGHITYFSKDGRSTDFSRGTEQTEAVILFAESLIINQCFNPEDLANRFVRNPILTRDKIIKQFAANYGRDKAEWYNSGVASLENSCVFRCMPAALINYGDSVMLRLIASIQTVITHAEETAIAASVVFSIAIAYLLNTPAFSLQSKGDLKVLIDIMSRSIKGAATKVYVTGKNNDVVNLYIMINRVLREWVKEGLPVQQIIEQWGSSSNVLESVPLSLYIFFKSPNDYEKVLKECLDIRGNYAIATMALALSGAYLGLNNIPKTYVNKIESGKEILVLSDRLFELSLKNRNNNPYRRLRNRIEVERSQDELDKLLWLAIKHNKTEEYEVAIKYFEDLVARSPELKKNERVRLHIIESYEGRGNKLLGEEKYEEALRCFKKALVYDLNHPVILCDIAIAYLNTDNLDKAERYVRRAVEIAPEYEIGRRILEGIKNLQRRNR